MRLPPNDLQHILYQHMPYPHCSTNHTDQPVYCIVLLLHKTLVHSLTHSFDIWMFFWYFSFLWLSELLTPHQKWLLLHKSNCLLVWITNSIYKKPIKWKECLFICTSENSLLNKTSSKAETWRGPHCTRRCALYWWVKPPQHLHNWHIALCTQANHSNLLEVMLTQSVLILSFIIYHSDCSYIFTLYRYSYSCNSQSPS